MDNTKPPGPLACKTKPDIDYPCQWLYKVIGKDPALVEKAIRSSCSPVPVKITPSHSSSKGSYWSLNAEVTVENEEMRLSIYRSLTNHPDVKLVL